MIQEKYASKKLCRIKVLLDSRVSLTKSLLEDLSFWTVVWGAEWKVAGEKCASKKLCRDERFTRF